MLEKPALYSFRRCPYAMRARLALKLAGITYEHREILLKDKPQSLLDYSPKGQVPVLVLGSSEVIDESLDIILWALNRGSGKGFFPQKKVERDFALNQVALNDSDFKKALDICKYKVRFSEEEFNEAKSRAYEILSEWNLLLEKQEYFHGKTFGFLDLALLPFVRQFSKIKPDIFSDFDLIPLKRWLAEGIESSDFNQIMEKHPLWQDK